MENSLNWEQSTLINELIQGMELAKQLRAHLNSTSSTESREMLIQRILSSYEKALLILKWSGSQRQPQVSVPITGVPESSASGYGSPRSEDCDRGFKDQQDQSDASKKRKVLPTWTDHVRICSENGLEGPMDDGYSWRKYGQKDILGAQYPRSYYRCTYRSTQNCWATKQVQRSDDNPMIFDLVYRGRHTCNQIHNTAPQPPPPAPSLDKQEPKQNQNQQQPSQNMLFNFRTSLRVNTEDLDNQEMNPHFTFPSWMRGENQNFAFSTLADNNLGCYSPSFVSPATSGTNYFSTPPCQMRSFGLVHNLRNSESDLTEIVSANTSATNSPIVHLDFSIDPVELDPNFPFDTPGFFQ
ncbi:WRKY transcription factor [Actinidia chinensis var. chinensis]|uniref:WRKY transcription factor n=1 Tax=Actinidia chinensis var. chinensis TaxID=1590841 RepID=A0A2R6PHT7_ACTCC|nr:WRKY transcription factor [Actinidia chinensis var. chinensis]